MAPSHPTSEKVTKPHITPLRTKSSWPGAMDFRIKAGERWHYLSVDSCKKLNWYIAQLTRDNNFPCGCDYG